jgi:hypothetical protein
MNRCGVLMCSWQVNLANNAYQLLDEAIRKLDTELRKFESELEQKELNLTAAERRKRKASLGIGAAEQRRMYAGSSEAFPRSDRKRVQVTRRKEKEIVLTLPKGTGWRGSHVRRGDGHAGGSQRADVLHLPASVVWRNGGMRQPRVSARVVSLRVRGALGQSQGQVALPRVLGRRPKTQTPRMKELTLFTRRWSGDRLMGHFLRDDSLEIRSGSPALRACALHDHQSPAAVRLGHNLHRLTLLD